MRLDRALNRVWQMLITRLRAEGETWRLWHRINVNSGRQSFFPQKFQDRKVIKFNDIAEYTIHPIIFRAYNVSFKAMRGAQPVTLARDRPNKPQTRTTGTKHPLQDSGPAPDTKHHRTEPPQATGDTAQGTTCTWYICKVGTKRPSQTNDETQRKRLRPTQHQPTPFPGIGPATQTSMHAFFTADT